MLQLTIVFYTISRKYIKKIWSKISFMSCSILLFVEKSRKTHPISCNFHILCCEMIWAFKFQTSLPSMVPHPVTPCKAECKPFGGHVLPLPRTEIIIEYTPLDSNYLPESFENSVSSAITGKKANFVFYCLSCCILDNSFSLMKSVSRMIVLDDYQLVQYSN